MQYQQMIEESKSKMLRGDQTARMPMGRHFAFLAFQSLQIDQEHGLLLSQDYLLALKIQGTGWKDLRAFRAKADLILKQFPHDERPSETTLRRWAYGCLKTQPLMARSIDIYDEAKNSSRKRTFKYLWERLNRVISRKEMEENQQSVANAINRAIAPGITPGAAGEIEIGRASCRERV